MKQKHSQSGVKKWFLAIGIALIFLLFVKYGTTTFFEEPQYDKYCTSYQEQEITINHSNKDECITSGGQWNAYDSRYEPKPVGGDGYCDVDFTCRKEFEEANKKFQDKAFYIMVIAGFIGLLLGLVLNVESVSAGFLLGGVLNLFFATVWYWDRFSNTIRFILLGVVLAILVWIAYKKTQ